MQKIVFQEQGNEDVACIPQQNINQQKTGNASIPVFIPFSQVTVTADGYYIHGWIRLKPVTTWSQATITTAITCQYST